MTSKKYEPFHNLSSEDMTYYKIYVPIRFKEVITNKASKDNISLNKYILKKLGYGSEWVP